MEEKRIKEISNNEKREEKVLKIKRRKAKCSNKKEGSYYSKRERKTKNIDWKRSNEKKTKHQTKKWKSTKNKKKKKRRMNG